MLDRMKNILIILILLNSIIIESNAEDYSDVSVSRIIKVIDGDTFRVDINELSDIIGKNIRIRILGIDAPEINGKCAFEKELAIKARDFVQILLDNADSVILKNLDRGNFFRLLAEVIVDGKNLGELLVAKDLAVRYQGKKSSWCIK
jgi:endonuclease YncB( thermonuclease family)